MPKPMPLFNDEEPVEIIATNAQAIKDAMDGTLLTRKCVPHTHTHTQ